MSCDLLVLEDNGCGEFTVEDSLIRLYVRWRHAAEDVGKVEREIQQRKRKLEKSLR